MQKIVFFIILLFSKIALAQDAQTFTLKAFLPYWNSSSIHLIIDGKRISSGSVQNDMFSYSGKISQHKNATLEIRKSNKTVFVPFILEPGTIRFRDKGNKTIEAFGTISNDTYLQAKHNIDSIASLLTKENVAEIKNQKRKTASEFIRHNTNSLVSLQLMNDLFYLDNAIDDTSYFKLFDLLDQSLKASTLGKKIAQEADISRYTAIGVEAPNFTITDIENQQSTIYEKGKYTLVDFWASWCLPCKKEIPSMVALYNKYRNTNFAMVSFSLDTDLAKLKNAIEKDKMLWKHLIDYKAWGSTIVKTYGVKTIPMNFLIDQNGIIIAKNLTPEALDLKLAQLTQSQF